MKCFGKLQGLDVVTPTISIPNNDSHKEKTSVITVHIQVSITKTINNYSLI